MRIFIGNPTHQHREFHYRVPGAKTARVLRIPAGGQEQIPGDFDGSAAKELVKQIESLGGVPKNDIRAIVYPKALVYDVSPSPISADVLNEGLARDEEARQDVSAQQMEKAGLAAYAAASAAGAHVVETSMEIVETTDRGPVKSKDAVNMEVVVSEKPSRRAGKKREEAKA